MPPSTRGAPALNSFGLIIRLCGWGTLLFSAVISVILLQPLRETDASQFYQAIFECSPPCLMGITPGVTTLDQADDVLRDHPWILVYGMQRGMEMDSGIIDWQWNGTQPPYIDGNRHGSLNVRSGIVTSVQLYLRLSLAEICLFAPPEGFDVRRLYGHQITFNAHYGGSGTTLQTGAFQAASNLRVNWLRALHTLPISLRAESLRSLIELGYTYSIGLSPEAALRCPSPRN